MTLPNDGIDPLFDTKSAARYLGVSPKTLPGWRSRKLNSLKAIKVGKKAVRYRKSELDRFLAEGMTP